MQHQEFLPSPELQDAIKCFWYDRNDFGREQTTFEVVPDGFAEIIFHFGSDLYISHSGGLRQLPSPFLMGLLNQPAIFHAKERFEIIGIRCYPWTVFDLLGLQPGKETVRLLEHPVARLQAALQKLISAGRMDDAIKKVKQYFLDARAKVDTDSLLFKAGISMSVASGSMAVKEVAAKAHATVRTLERKFKRSSGYTVKDVSALMRFEQVRNQLWLRPEATLADLALEWGYTDASHLSREFKRFSGTTPAAFARNSKRGKFAAGNDLITFI